MQMLHKDEARYLKTNQLWQDEVSQIALQVNEKIKDFKATQTIVMSLLEEPTTTELVDTTKECVDQLEKDLVGLQDKFTSFKKKIMDMHDSEKKSMKKTIGDSGMSHN